MGYSDLVETGVKRIYSEDLESQKHYITEICQSVRNIEPAIVLKAQGFFIPNDDYLKFFFDAEVTSNEYDFYNVYGECQWTGRLALPITNAVGRICGLVAFDAFRYLEAHEQMDWTLNYYYYSNKRIFDKGYYLYGLPGVYKEALHQGYLILTDGVFDTLSFAKEGYLAMAALGSVVTDAMAAQLRFIKRVIVAVDNDDAGMMFYEKLSKVLDNVVLFAQNVAKDADDVIKSEHREGYLKELDKCIHNEIFIPMRFRKRFSTEIHRNT